MPKKLRLPEEPAASAGNGTVAKPPARATAEAAIVLSTAEGFSVRLPLESRLLPRAAVEWSWVVRNRGRWTASADGKHEQATRSKAQLADLGLSDAALGELAKAPIVQVSIPFVDETTHWAPRIFPWEYVLSAAIAEETSQPMTVVRHLEGAGRARVGGGASPAPAPTLFVESAPGQLRQRFSFESERLLVESNLRDVKVEPIADPTPDSLKAAVERLRPRAIHLAGLDSHQGAQLLGLDDPGYDGYVLLDDRRSPLFFGAEDLAAVLNAGSSPRLVALNFRNSGARLAAMTVARGAEAAIGFQDQVDDSVAELFFASFYATWRELGWATVSAFVGTFRRLVAQSQSLNGTGIILWSGRDAFESPVEVPVEPPAPQVNVQSAGVISLPLGGDLGDAARPYAPRTPLRDAVWVEARPYERLNYSLLHNDRNLFEAFRIRKRTDEPVPAVDVEVILFAGGDSFPYRVSLDLLLPVTELKDRIRVPLTSAVLRTFRESVQSVLFVQVSSGGETIYRDTKRISLVPVEEWKNDDRDAIWLPSFVLPRDPAIAQIVDAAQASLRALKDNGHAGFDGYQSIDLAAKDPYAGVDLQVLALWSALSYQFDLSYISPPPSYSPNSQRLRTPTEVVRTRSGTCLDLALLLASCLEYIEIFPVLFLLNDHALPGYWRSWQLHDDFEKVRPAVDGNDPAGGLPDHPSELDEAREIQQVPWQLRRHSGDQDPTFKELLARVRRKDVVPLETIGMTDGSGFKAAIREGEDHLRRGKEFRSLIDIQIARSRQITPLPIDLR